ncbi:MAG: hypothetical protein WCA23_06655, partial [Stellaceae bacterium]
MPGSADNRIAADAHVRLRYFCSPYHQDSLLFPIIGQLEHAAGFAPRRYGCARLRSSPSFSTRGSMRTT